MREDRSQKLAEKKKGIWRRLMSVNQCGRRVGLLILFIVSLTYFLHFREVRMELFKVGTLAPRYVIAQIDFEFPDREATQLLKQEAARDIEAIFRIDQEKVHAFRQNFENQLIEHQIWKQSLKSTFEKLYQVLEEVEKELIQARFTSEGTLEKMQESHLEDEHFYPILFYPNASLPQTLPESFWSGIAERLNDRGSFQSKTIRYVIDAFSEQVWTLQEDVSLARYLRQVVQEGIPNKYTQIEAGNQIIARGETVTSGHITMLQSMKLALASSLTLWTPLTLFGSALLSVSLTVVVLIYLKLFHSQVLSSLRQLTLLFSIVISTLFLAKFVEYLLLHEGIQIIEMIRFQLVIPFATMLTCILMGTELALLVSFFLTIVLGVTLAVDHVFFLLLNFFASLATIFFARALHKRKQVFSVCFKVWLSCIPLLIVFNLIENTLWNMNLVTDLGSSFAFLTIIALLTVGLLPIFESLFQVMTDMTLMEYMDPNHELLRRLSVEAPGTYQHCLVVGNLAEVAARAIGANGLFCRVVSLYHDVGKLFNPHYFTENQLGGFNIHQLLTPLESTHVIMAHVSEGEALARKYRLPESFIDIIREHHGTTLVYYFYCKQLEQMSEDVHKVNQNLFRYPGPKPQSKESGIMMIADTLEAASRSMDQVTEESILQMIDKLVFDKIQDGQFDACQLTFKELGIVKKTMARAIMVSRHLRVKYPDRH